MADLTDGQSLDQGASALSAPDRIALERQGFPFQDQRAQGDKFPLLVCSRPLPCGFARFALKFPCAVKRGFQSGGIEDFEPDDC